MEARNLNQYRMAKLCGMQVSEINQILDPERTPLLHNVLHICAALDIKLHPRQTPD
jgi:DNA-binding phage protein